MRVCHNTRNLGIAVATSRNTFSHSNSKGVVFPYILEVRLTTPLIEFQKNMESAWIEKKHFHQMDFFLQSSRTYLKLFVWYWVIQKKSFLRLGTYNNSVVSKKLINIIELLSSAQARIRPALSANRSSRFFD